MNNISIEVLALMGLHQTRLMDFTDTHTRPYNAFFIRGLVGKIHQIFLL